MSANIETQQAPPARFHYNAIDILRAFACLWVFSVHMPMPNLFIDKVPWVGPLFDLPLYSFLTFFIISGLTIYLATCNSLSKNQPAGKSLWRRLVRVYPTYWASIPVVMALPYVVEIISAVKSGQMQWPHPGYLQYNWMDWGHIVLLTRIFLIPEGGEPSTTFQAINSPIWALGVILQFYLFMSLIHKFFPRYLAWSLAGMVLIGLFTVLIPGSWVKGIVFYYGMAFGCGGLLGVVIRHGWTPNRVFGKHASLLNLVVLVVAVAVTFDVMLGQTWLKPLRSTAFSIALAVTLWSLYHYDSRVHQFRHTKIIWLKPVASVLFTLCAMSFTIYLLHGKMYWLGMVVARQASTQGTAAFMIITMIVTILLCYPFYRWIEKPLTASSKSQPAKASEPKISSSPVPAELPEPEACPVMAEPINQDMRPDS